MSFIHWLLDILRDPSVVVAASGAYLTLSLIVFAESAFFPVLPGDSMLVVAGIYAARGYISLPVLCLVLIPAAVIGNGVAYGIGHLIGPRLFTRPGSRLFRPEYSQKAHDFYERHGGKAIIIARFIPIVRTFVPVIAGIARMGYPRFVAYNIAGAVAWIVSLSVAGYALGDVAARNGFPLDKHIEKVMIVVVLLSIMPGVFEYLRARRKANAKT